MLKNENVQAITMKKNLLPFSMFHSSDNHFLNLSKEQLEFVSRFNKKVSNKEIAFESVSCLCGANVFDLIASVDSYSLLQKTILCTNCGLIQSNPRMNQQEYTNFYTSELYRLCYEGKNYLELSKRKYDTNYTEHILNEIDKIKSVNSDLAVLEFGAGGGWNLLPFIKRGAMVLGIDNSQNLVKLGQEHRIPMKQGDIDDIDGVFDAIILNHVLEHFLNPLDSLRNIAKHLKENGIIYIAVPNIFNFGLGQLQNAHTYYFTPETFKYYCAKSGLEIIAQGTAQNIHMFGIFKISDRGIPYKLNGHYKKMLNHFNKIKIRQYAKYILESLHLYRSKN